MAPETYGVTGTLSGPLLENLLEAVRAILGDPLKARELRAQNTPIAVFYDQPAAGVTGNTIYTIIEIQSQPGVFFTSLTIFFASTSGLGRYMVTPADPISPTNGIPIPSGATFLTLEGYDNIKNFRMMAEAGQTLLFSRVLFR